MKAGEKHSGGMPEGSWGVERSDTPGSGVVRSRTPAGCQIRCSVPRIWHPAGMQEWRRSTVDPSRPVPRSKTEPVKIKKRCRNSPEMFTLFASVNQPPVSTGSVWWSFRREFQYAFRPLPRSLWCGFLWERLKASGPQKIATKSPQFYCLETAIMVISNHSTLANKFAVASTDCNMLFARPGKP